MARQVNPFAVCKAAGKRGRWPKKKIERCIRTVKSKAGVGHITSIENSKASQAVWMGKQLCNKMVGDQKEACLSGVRFVADELGFAGFSLSGRRRR